jgi:glycosyltransferase involved in cell wall biosynthesis
LLYQGAVNHARGLEYLIPAMKQIEAVLHIYGDGNFMDDTRQLIQQNNLEDKVLLMGKADPMELRQITQSAYLGFNLVEPVGLNQWFSLANKFFDYIHAGIPQVTMNFPEYKRINEAYPVAVLIDQLSENEIARAVNSLMSNQGIYQQLQSNCARAAAQLNWQNEEKKLIEFYHNLLG